MISGEFIKGSLKTLVLNLLKREGALHGYAIIRKIEELTGGKMKLSYGAIYPILYKLKNDGVLVTSSDIYNNRIRIYYALTDKGQSVAKEKNKELTEFIQSIQHIVGPKT